MIGAIAESVIPQTLEGLHSLYVRVYQYGKKWIDLDNVFKAILDGLDNSKTIKRGKKEIQVCGTGIKNDKFFQLVVGERAFVQSKEEERVEVVIAPYGGVEGLKEIIEKEYGKEAIE